MGGLPRLAAALTASFAALAALAVVIGAAATPPGLFGVGASACEQPCWQGIAPGVTTEAEALRLLARSPHVQPGSVARRGEELHWITAEGWTGRAAVQGGRVRAVSLFGAFPLGDLIADMGPPERVWMRYTRDILNDKQVNGWLFYPEARVSAETLGGRPGPPLLSPKLFLRGVYYAPKGVYEALAVYDLAAPWEGLALGRYLARTR